MAMENSGYGWEAPSEYMISAAGTYLGWANDRQYYKTNDGAAIALFQVSSDHMYVYGWRGPVLISTNRNAVAYHYGNTYLEAEGSVFYNGRMWYYNFNHHFQTHSYGTPLYEFDADQYGTTAAEIVPKLLASFGAKQYVSTRSKAFLAGLAVGLTADLRDNGTSPWGDLQVARFNSYQYRLVTSPPMTPLEMHSYKKEVTRGLVYGFYTFVDPPGYYNIKLLSESPFDMKTTIYQPDGSIKRIITWTVTSSWRGWWVEFITNVPSFGPAYNTAPDLPREPNDNLNAMPPPRI